MPSPSPPAPAPAASPQLALGYDPAWPMKPVDVVGSKSSWNEFTLEDGSIIKLKVALLDVKRAIDRFTDDGKPLYVMQWAVINQVDAPDHLKKKG
jgi:hypothetical protein